MESVEALVEALNDYTGAVVLVSHDAGFIERCADTLWLVKEGSCKVFPGDFEQYRELCLAPPQQSGSEGTGPKRVQQRREAAQMRAALAPLKKRCEETEKAVQRLAEQKLRIEQTLADPSLYEGPRDKLTEWQRRQARCCEQLAQAEEAWLLAAQAYHEAEADWVE
jgi:ATP-binding cassette subfamily F protein 3